MHAKFRTPQSLLLSHVPHSYEQFSPSWNILSWRGVLCGSESCKMKLFSSKEWGVLKIRAVSKQIANFKKVPKLARFRGPFLKVLKVVNKCWKGLVGQNLPPVEIPRKDLPICRLCRELWGYSYNIHHFCLDELFSEVSYIWVIPVPLMISHSLAKGLPNNWPTCNLTGSILQSDIGSLFGVNRPLCCVSSEKATCNTP